jgi:hypothetical protein
VRALVGAGNVAAVLDPRRTLASEARGVRAQGLVLQVVPVLAALTLTQTENITS